MQISKDDIDVLKFYDEAGINESCGCEPFNFMADGGIFVKKSFDNVSNDTNISILKAKQEAEKIISKINSVKELRKAVSEFSLNPLSKFASNSICGVGVDTPDLLVITEMPNSDEDRSGVPMSGATGDLLRKILTAINSSVETNTYTFPASPFRAPGARMPTGEEMEISIPFMKKFIQVLKPKIILSMGSLPTNILLDSDEPITSLRGVWAEYQGIPVMPTFALTYLLNNRDAKKKAWEDLQLLMQKL